MHQSGHEAMIGCRDDSARILSASLVATLIGFKIRDAG
jgi:hypothetical protein